MLMTFQGMHIYNDDLSIMAHRDFMMVVAAGKEKQRDKNREREEWSFHTFLFMVI
jgi:hypothetical protein